MPAFSHNSVFCTQERRIYLVPKSRCKGSLAPCPLCSGRHRIQSKFYHPKLGESVLYFTYPNPRLYESFHGAQPKGVRKVNVEFPKNGDKLVKIGRLVSLEYQPEKPSKYSKVKYRHTFGDTGKMVLPQKPILATRENGKGLFIIEDKSRMTSRGIIG